MSVLNKILDGGKVSQGLKKSRHADRDIKPPNYHKHEPGYLDKVKPIRKESRHNEN